MNTWKYTDYLWSSWGYTWARLHQSTLTRAVVEAAWTHAKNRAKKTGRNLEIWGCDLLRAEYEAQKKGVAQ
jgi:hypothetical protein